MQITCFVEPIGGMRELGANRHSVLFIHLIAQLILLLFKAVILMVGISVFLFT